MPVHQQRLLGGVPDTRDTEARVSHCTRGYSRAQLPHEDRRQGQHGAVRERLGAEVHILDGGAQGLELVPRPPWQYNVLVSAISIIISSSATKRSIRRFVITEKAPTRAFSWLKAATTAFTFKTLLRHYAKQALTPQSLNVKLGLRRKGHKGRAVWLA